MTPERMAALVTRWTRTYTRGLPAAIQERRAGEIAADLHDQIAHERAEGAGDRRIALHLLSRGVRGLPADVTWRREQARAIAGRDRSLLHIVLATALLLSVPLVGMLVSDSVVWGPFDFAVAGTLIMGTLLLLRAAARQARDPAYRAAAVVGIGAAFLLAWVNLAVGIIGPPEEPANAMYLGVLAVGVLGAVAARLRPEGMARALLAMAVAQAVAAAIALVAGKHEVPGSSVAEILALNGMFAALFVASALLFGRAAPRGPRLDARPQE